MSRIGDILDDGERLFRGTFLGHTWLLILLGAGSANPHPEPTQLAVLLLIGLNYHFFGYIHNDLIDLPVDRTQPLRANDPLVSGRISEPHAWLFVTLQIPMSFVLVWWVGASATTYVVLTVGYLATIAYNLYGKRCSIPMITDGVQGIAWGSLALTGVYLVGEPTALSWIPVGFGFSYIFLINGVHGGLRDLANDQHHGRITTSIYFGAKSSPGGRVSPSWPLRWFAIFAFCLLLAPTCVGFLAGVFPYIGTVLWLVLGSWLLVNICSVWLFYQVLRDHQPERRHAINQHQFPLLMPPIMVMLPAVGWSLQLSVLAGFFVPMLFFNARVRNLAGWLRPGRVFSDQSDD